jgi:hypothetical protein
MTYEQARVETKALFGEDSFTEFDDEGAEGTRYYVGECPLVAGVYTGFMGYSWEEALDLAKKSKSSS